MSKSKTYIVASIIDAYKIVINGGYEDGISINQRFLVYSLSEEDIIDPITGQKLGKLEIIKGTGKVTHVQAKMSTIESDSYKISSKKRTIKTSNPLISFGGSEEIVEDSEPKHMPFDEVSIEDHAKLIATS